jgi:hypothetical protein
VGDYAIATSDWAELLCHECAITRPELKGAFNMSRRVEAASLFILLIAAIAVQGQTFTILQTFTNGPDGANPYTGLTMDRVGNLYGTAEYGGFQGNDCGLVNGCGTVFELDRHGAGLIFRPLYQFQGFPSGDGANPLTRVIVGPDGALYGTTAYGGQQTEGCGGTEPGCGTVFKLTPQPTPCKSFICNWEETQIHNFSGAADGAVPLGEIAFDAAGNLYGATLGYGPQRWGTAYELTPAQGSWTLTLLHAFAEGFDGGNPRYGVQLDADGNVYGTNNIGGTGQDGIAFQLVPSGSGWALNILYNFDYDSGGFISTGLIVGPGGNLYGGTADGNPNPLVYELSPSNGSWIYNTLYTFSSYQYCCGVAANLVMDSAGNLYGTTAGSSLELVYGTVFKLTPSDGGWIYTDLHNFTGGSDGAYPLSSIVLDSNGNLYGTASGGGTDGYGTVWEITP